MPSSEFRCLKALPSRRIPKPEGLLLSINRRLLTVGATQDDLPLQWRGVCVCVYESLDSASMEIFRLVEKAAADSSQRCFGKTLTF